MGIIKLPKNFTLSRESIKKTLTAFKVNKFVTDVTREVFQVVTLVSSARPFSHAPTPSLALVLVSGGPHSVASKTSVPPKALTSFEAPPAQKGVPKEPILVNKSAESNSKEDTRSTPLDVHPIRAMGAIAIERRAAKHARTSKPSGAAPSPLVDRGKR